MPLLAGLGPLGLPELLIIAFVVILIFGVGRLPEVGGALGKGIREFRKSTRDEEEPAGGTTLASSTGGALDTSATPPPAVSADNGPPPVASGSDARFCSECGARNPREARFCAQCGHQMATPVA